MTCRYLPQTLTEGIVRKVNGRIKTDFILNMVAYVERRMLVKTIHRGYLKGIWLLAFFVVAMVMPPDKVGAFPCSVIEDAGVVSWHKPDDSIGTIFYAYISGPSPEDVVSFTVTGPSGPFNMIPMISSRERGLTYIHIESSVVINGSYTFEITDSLTRTASVVKNFTFNNTLPRVDSSFMIPKNETYVGTTTPILSFDSVGDPGQFYYKVYLSDYNGQAFWYMSSITQDTEFTVPEGLLQPNTAYTWYVRVFDSDTDPQNCHQSESRSFYTGSKDLPDLSAIFVTSIEISNFGTTWFGVRNTNIAPWDKAYLKVTSPDTTVYYLNEILFRFNESAYYQIFNDSPFPMPDGSYEFEIEDDDGNYDTECLTHQYDPLPFIAENAITPANNTYFSTDTLNFSWNALEGTGPYYYRVRVWDYNHKVIWYDSTPTTDTWVAIPVSGNFVRGDSYKWQLIVYDSIPQPDNMTVSSQRSFTINLEGVYEGDFNCDNDVDDSDLVIFADHFDRTDCDPGDPCEGDIDGDNDVDGSDLAKFAADFGGSE